MISNRINFMVHRKNSWKKSLCLSNDIVITSSRGLLRFEDIPRAPSFPIFGNTPHLLMAGGETRRLQYVDSLHKELGPIFVDRVAGNDIVYLSNPSDGIKMFNVEGRFPTVLLPPLWTEHLIHSKKKRGLLFMSGKKWEKTRKACHFVHKIAHMDTHAREITSITRELMDIWKENPPKDLRYHLYSWNTECIGVTVLGRRFGFLDKLKLFNECNEKHVEEDKLIESALSFTDSLMLYLPLSLRRLFNKLTYRSSFSAVDHELSTVEKYVEKAVEECMTDNPSEMTKQSVLYKLMEDKLLEIETIKRVVTDMVISSTFSVSNAASWAFYLLGQHPIVAERVRKQVISTTRNGDVNIKFLNEKIPLLNGAIKESQRIYPTAPLLNRLIEKDAEFSGYHVPKGTIVLASMFTMGRDPKNFSYPHCFLPERWSSDNVIKETIAKNHIPEAFLPFSHNQRNCIGRLIAKMALRVLMLEALKNYEWSSNEVDMELKFVLTPSEPIELKLKSCEK